MEKHNEFHTDISQNGTRFRLTFITNDKNNFLAMQDLARKFVDSTTEKRWIEVFHEVIATRYSMRNRNFVKYECPECGNMQDTTTSCCQECRIRLGRPIAAERKVVEV